MTSDEPRVTRTGKVLTDEDVEALADEAEVGYDVSHLVDKPRRRGAAGRWTEGDRVCTLDGRPGPGTVHGTIVTFARVLTAIRPDPTDPNFAKAVVDESGLIWAYEHDIFDPDEEVDDDSA